MSVTVRVSIRQLHIHFSSPQTCHQITIRLGHQTINFPIDVTLIIVLLAGSTDRLFSQLLFTKRPRPHGRLGVAIVPRFTWKRCPTSVGTLVPRTESASAQRWSSRPVGASQLDIPGPAPDRPVRRSKIRDSQATLLRTTCERQLAVAGRHGLGWIHPRECETTTRSRRVRVPSAFACRAGRGRRRTPNRTPPSSCSRRTPVLDRLLCAALENLVIRATSWGPQTPSWGLQKGSGSRAQCKPADGEPAPSQSKQIRGRLVRRVL
jgi:hypothetical protein